MGVAIIWVCLLSPVLWIRIISQFQLCKWNPLRGRDENLVLVLRIKTNFSFLGITRNDLYRIQLFLCWSWTNIFFVWRSFKARTLSNFANRHLLGNFVQVIKRLYVFSIILEWIYSFRLLHLLVAINKTLSSNAIRWRGSLKYSWSFAT